MEKEKEQEEEEKEGKEEKEEVLCTGQGRMFTETACQIPQRKTRQKERKFV